MHVNQILELSMMLDNEKFQNVLGGAYRQAEGLEENEDGHIDRSLARKGITVIYRDSRYKKKIRLIVNAYLLLDDAANTDKLIRKLDRWIAKYFNSKYHLADFDLSGVSLVADIDVATQSKAQAYLKAIKRIGRVKGFSPVCYEYFDDDSGFCLSGNSNGIDFLLYDLERSVMNQSDMTKPIKGVLRAEVRLTKAKAIRAYSDADDVHGQIGDLSKNCRNIEKVMDAFAKETLIKAFPAPDLRRKAANSIANPCASAGGFKEILI